MSHHNTIYKSNIYIYMLATPLLYYCCLPEIYKLVYILILRLYTSVSINELRERRHCSALSSRIQFYFGDLQRERPMLLLPHTSTTSYNSGSRASSFAFSVLLCSAEYYASLTHSKATIYCITKWKKACPPVPSHRARTARNVTSSADDSSIPLSTRSYVLTLRAHVGMRSKYI